MQRKPHDKLKSAPIQSHTSSLSIDDPYKDLIAEDTFGDGNCAFNAFALGFCQPEVINQIQYDIRDIEFVNFYVSIADQLKINPDWETVKKELIKLRLGDKEQLRKLQRVLAPCFRELAYNLEYAFKKKNLVKHFQFCMLHF